MPAKRTPEDLSIDELRRLLVEKRRKARQGQIERFRQTGRVVTLASDVPTSPIQERASDGSEDAQPAPPSRRRRLMDGLLLFVELGAVLALVLLVVGGLDMLRSLNQQFTQDLALPSLTPTPLIVALVLPSGHTPPTDPGGARPNEAEIPEHLRPLVQNQLNVVLPTPSPEQASRIQAKTIGVDAPIVQGDGWEQLKKGVGQHIGTANPGEKGNMVLSAHNDVFGEIFRDLDKLKTGDSITIFTSQRAYTYIVASSEIVEPTFVEVMGPTPQAAITLISCYPYLVDNKRIVVRAYLQGSTK